jgi:hypothetical protein
MRLGATVEVDRLDPVWVRAVVASIVQRIEAAPLAADGTLGPGGGARSWVLVEGHHAWPGARYAARSTGGDHGAAAELSVDSWDHQGELRARYVDSSPDQLENLVVLDRPLTLRQATMVGAADVPAPVMGGRMTWHGELDLDQWWAPSADRRSVAPARLDVEARRLRATVAARPHELDSARWRIVVEVRLHGRGIARPVMAAGLLVARIPLRRALRGAVADFGAVGQKAADAARTRTPDSVAEHVVERLLAPPVRTGPSQVQRRRRRSRLV